jgi:hypothetical protein
MASQLSAGDAKADRAVVGLPKSPSCVLGDDVGVDTDFEASR